MVIMPCHLICCQGECECECGYLVSDILSHVREAVLWMSVKHQNKKAVELWAKEIAAAGTGGTPGITAAVGGRPKPSPCLKLFSFLHPKDKVDASVNIDGQSDIYSARMFDEQPIEDAPVPQIGEI